jgi:3-isopropylmalate/(R)-2-methylmalate dehydratase large subunit
MTEPRTLLQKIWESHVVAQEEGAPAVLYIDRHLVHEVTSPQAFTGLRARRLRVRRPDLTTATADHSIPTRGPVVDEQAAAQLRQLEENCREFEVPLFGRGSPAQGIVHVMGPEQGLTQPGMTIVCGDSHTATHGAFGALAFGIGTSEVEHVLATQCLLQHRPRNYEVRVDGRLPAGVSAKDVILALIARIGVGGGTGHVFEFTGSGLSARAGLVAPDDVTFQYLAGRPAAPKGAAWDRALARWRALPSDPGARFDRSISLDAAALEPMITFGTNPGMGMGVGGRIPDPAALSDASQRAALEKALGYMGFRAGQPIAGQPVQVVFIGSCTNGRISDLRAAATVLRGRKVAPGMRVLVVPGSQIVKKQAEAEGLDRVFVEAGAEWRNPGCSMCIAMNGDQLQPGEYAVSTSNRNFEGRQGKGGRTLLASPLTAAASAVTGKVTDPRTLPRA